MQASVTGASVRGLKGCKTLNKDPDPKNPLEGTEERSVSYTNFLSFKKELGLFFNRKH